MEPSDCSSTYSTKEDKDEKEELQQQEEAASSLTSISTATSASTSSGALSSVDGAGALGSGGGGGGGDVEAVQKELMFEKRLTPTDVGNLNRLVLPSQHAEKYFPLDAAANEKGLLLSFEDRAGKLWRFRYSYWKGSQSYVITKGWSGFVNEKRLVAGDIVAFARGVGEAARGRFFIDFRRRRPDVAFLGLPGQDYGAHASSAPAAPSRHASPPRQHRPDADPLPVPDTTPARIQGALATATSSLPRLAAVSPRLRRASARSAKELWALLRVLLQDNAEPAPVIELPTQEPLPSQVAPRLANTEPTANAGDLELALAGGMMSTTSRLELTEQHLAGLLQISAGIPIQVIWANPAAAFCAILVASLGVVLWRKLCKPFMRMFNLWWHKEPPLPITVPDAGRLNSCLSRCRSLLHRKVAESVAQVASSSWLAFLILSLWFPTLRPALQPKVRLVSLINGVTQAATSIGRSCKDLLFRLRRQPQGGRVHHESRQLELSGLEPEP